MAEPTTGSAEYQRVADGLRERVRKNGMQPGDELPSLQEVMAEYDVTVMVARRALFELRADGLIKTRQGKRAIVVDPRAANRQSDDVAALTRLIDALQDEVRRNGQDLAELREQVSRLERELPGRPGRRGSVQPDS